MPKREIAREVDEMLSAGALDRASPQARGLLDAAIKMAKEDKQFAILETLVELRKELYGK